MKIESADQDLRTMLSSAYYRIPRFQRPYSWDRQNIEDFWQDVVKENPQDYFIGSMVVYRDGTQRYGVVDGQQRLTTITILLSVLRDTMQAEKLTDLATGVHGLIERKNIDNKPEFIVSTESSYPFFQSKIQHWGKESLKVNLLREETSLQTAQQQLRELVIGTVQSIRNNVSLSEKRKSEAIEQKLIAIRDALLNLKVILVKLDNEDDAYIIFETLNTRGKDLALADLLKNHLTKLLKAKNANSDQVKLKWKQLLEMIEGSSVDLRTDTFVHHFWLSKYDYLPAKDLFKAIKKRVSSENAALFLDSLLDDSKVYRQINEPGFGKWSNEERELARSLTDTTIFRVAQQIPCVLSLMREYKSGKLKRKHIEEAVVAIEKFHFLFTAVTSQRSSGGISGMYAALGRKLFEAPDTQGAYKVIGDLKQKLRDRIPSREEFRALFPEILFTDTLSKERKLVRYILAGFYRHEQNASPVDFQSMTIEHIIPQSLIGTGDFVDENVGALGNLLFVSVELNQRLKDKKFREKKQILLAGGYKLPMSISEAETWDIERIQARTLELADDAYDVIWKP